MWIAAAGLPVALPSIRLAVFVAATGIALLLAIAIRRSAGPRPEPRPAWQPWLAYPVLAAAPVVIEPLRPPWFWWVWGAAVVLGPLLLGLVERRLLPPAGPTPRRVGIGVVLALLVAYFCALFPPATWNHAVFTDDYGIVFYNTVKDLDAWAAGGLWGWDHDVEGGRSLFLSLRTLAPLVAPFLFFGREVAFHLMLLLVWIAFPLLAGGALAAVLRPRAREAVSAAFAWGVFAGGLFLLSLSTNLFLCGMIYSVAVLDLLLLQLILLDRVQRGGRFAAIGLGLAVGLGVYVHLVQQCMGLVILAAVFGLRLLGERRPPPWKLWIGAPVTALGVALPYLAQLWIHRDALDANYLMGISPVIAHFAAVGPVETARLLISDAIWTFPGYFRVLVVMLPLVGLVAIGGRARLGGHVLFAVILLVATFLVWIPSAGYAMLRLHFLIPVVLAPIAGEALRVTAGRGRAALLVGLGLLIAFLPGMQPWPVALVSAPSLAELDGGLVRAVRTLPGHRVLFENSAGQSPLRDLTAPYDVFRGSEVQRGGPLALAAARPLFAHAGWDPYPYHGLRDAFIVNGAWQGTALGRVDEAAFLAALERYAVGGAAVWSPGARRFFAARPQRFEPAGEVPAQAQPISTPAYALFRVRGAPVGAVRVAGGGSGELLSRGPFHYEARVTGVAAGASITVVARHLPGWTAVDADGIALPVVARDGLLAVSAPRGGELTVRFRYDRRTSDLLAALCVIALGAALCLTARPRPATPPGPAGRRR